MDNPPNNHQVRTVAQEREELRLLQLFTKSDAYADFQAEVDAKKDECDRSVYGPVVPQTIGDFVEREQRIGLGCYLLDMRDWFTTRIEACEQRIRELDLNSVEQQKNNTPQHNNDD